METGVGRVLGGAPVSQGPRRSVPLHPPLRGTPNDRRLFINSDDANPVREVAHDASNHIGNPARKSIKVGQHPQVREKAKPVGGPFSRVTKGGNSCGHRHGPGATTRQSGTTLPELAHPLNKGGVAKGIGEKTRVPPGEINKTGASEEIYQLGVFGVSSSSNGHGNGFDPNTGGLFATHPLPLSDHRFTVGHRGGGDLNVPRSPTGNKSRFDGLHGRLVFTGAN